MVAVVVVLILELDQVVDQAVELVEVESLPEVLVLLVRVMQVERHQVVHQAAAVVLMLLEVMA